MTLQEYIDNPAGKGDSSMNRAVIISTLNEKYEKLIKNKTIKVNVYYTIGLHSEYYIHLVIPTETERDNTYDVVFHLFRSKENKSDNPKKFDIKVFANTPSFAYTFLNVYHKEGLFEETLSNKFDKIFFKESPEKRNKYGIVNYDKYLYFAAKFITESFTLNNKAALDLRAVNYNSRVFNSKIRTFDRIMDEYKIAENKLKDKKYKEKKKALQANTSNRRASNGVIEPKSPKAPKVKTPKKPKVKTLKKK